MKTKKVSEKSFTLLETLIALGLMVFLIIEVGGIQGNAILFSQYGRKTIVATWLAKRIMSQVEYHWQNRPFTELDEANEKERQFEDDPDYTYSVEVKEWKLPLLDMLTGGGMGGESDEDEGGDKEEKPGGTGDFIKEGLKSVFGDDILKTATVEVSWPEGARRNSLTLTMLLTNQQKLNDVIGDLKSVADGLAKPTTPTGPTPVPTPTQPAG